MKNKTLLLVCALALPISAISTRAADSTTPAAPTGNPERRRDEGGGGPRIPGMQALTQEERDKLKAANETAMKDPNLQAAQEKMRAAMKDFRETMDAALLAADPSVAPILKKLQEAREKAGPGRERGGAPQTPRESTK